MQIALTFDDGPNTTTTMQVLDQLEKYQIVASFFLVGDSITSESAKSVKRAFDMGCEIDNHSKTHSAMPDLSKEEIENEITYTTNKIIEITGCAPKFFRPPYIALNDLMFETIDLPFICGNGAEDWEISVSANERAKRIIESAKDGGIILLHDMLGNNQTVEALDTIIPTLKDKGYEFVTVSKLFKDKNIKPTIHSKIIYSNVTDCQEYR